MNKLTIVVVLSLVYIFAFNETFAGGFELPGPLDEISINKTSVVQDTIPLKDRNGDFLTDKSKNPFDINTSLITQEVEYDPETGNYILTEKIGDEYYRMPTYMTFQEYMDWKSKQQERDFFQKMNGVETGTRGSGGKIDPISNVNIERNLIDRLFGGNEITIKPKGNIDISLFGFYQKSENPNLPIQNQVQWGPNFDMDIKMSVDGNIGDKMNLGFNFNTQSTFDFDNRTNLTYDSEKWSEDEIIKKIEAGNVSLPLRSSLIQGGQNLFGIKLETQFGKLKLTTIASQKNSSQEELTISSGGLEQEFEVRPDEYDQNRHFFISNFNRNTYESALENLPQITTPFRITKIQVWITNDRNETDGLRNIIALADLGVGDVDNLTNPDAIQLTPEANDPTFIDYTGENVLPDNRVNDLYEQLVADQSARDQTTAATVLTSKYGLTQTKDFEILQARQLRPSEFTYHPELGFISLNIRLRPNQVLAVTYQYSYSYNGSEVYQVGEMANDVNYTVPPKNLFARLLKNTTQNTDEPNWDLMMKNVYSIGASQLDRESFKFDIFYEDNSDGSLKRYIPRGDLRNRPLLDVFNLDRLNVYNDPQQDGIFDFVEGVTVIPRTGSIIFPVLEPFGSSLEKLIGDPMIAEEFAYPELYTNTLFQAQERLERNRFVMKGEYKSSVSSEIDLGAWNIPQGSVTVRAGSQILREGIDYEINYGIGQIRIINDAYLQQGVPIRVSYEDNSLFNLNRKGMIGTRADYEVNKHLNIGGTYMHLFERPYTQKVNIGDDPINNRIYGLDMNYNNEIPWITRALDVLPFYSTKAPSSLSFNAEVAALRPGHARAINGGEDKDGIIMLDDFEGASSAIPLGIQPNQWMIASVPGGKGISFPEQEYNDLRYGYNRAMLNWYVTDRTIRNSADREDPYARDVDLTELFPNKNLQPGTFSDILTFDMTYYPDERGPYNFDPPNGSDISAGSYWDNQSEKMKLNDPESRWAGIMRFLNNNNFEQANVEFIEFWMLNPYMDRRDGSGHVSDEAGTLVFNLGNVSEDVMKDNLQFYENGIPVTQEQMDFLPVQQTVWSDVPLVTPKVNGFDQNNRDAQDLGLDGIDDAGERVKFQEYLELVKAAFPLAEVSADPANDNFIFFDNETVFNNENTLFERYYNFNGPEGNAPNPTQSSRERGNPLPDKEDLNNNRSLDQGESYYEYEVKLFNQNGDIDEEAAEYVTESRTIGTNEKWYRFRIPISEGVPINGIQGFQSIQFIRMYVKGFETQKTFRFADLQLIRNQWRRYVPTCGDGANPVEFSVDKVSIEENNSRQPFNYVLPPGIVREVVFNSYAQLQQDERSMALNVKNLYNVSTADYCEASIIKLTRVDLRVFKKLQMFVHAESIAQDLDPGDLSLFVRLGKDFSDNYYEYVIPLTMSDTDLANADKDPEIIWLKENMMDIDLSIFTEIKKERNINGADFAEVYPAQVVDQPERRAYIKGNPSLGYIKGIQIGLRNTSSSNEPIEASVWVNELRMSGLDERGGVAGLARMDLQLADLGNLTLAGSFNTIGWGALDQKLDLRSKESVTEYDVAANLELGKLMPSSFGISLPLYAQYANTTKTPQFDPYDLDLTVREKIQAEPDRREDILDLALDKTTIKTINFTNVRKQRNPDRELPPMPWDISNFSASYSVSQVTHQDPIIQSDLTDNQQGGLDYTYSRRANYIEPFKAIKSKHLKLISDINFNPLPNSFTFNTQLKKYYNERKYRLPEEFDYRFFDQRFTWDRRYNLQWDLTKGLNLSFSADNLGVVDELRQVGLADNARIVDERGETRGKVGEVTDREIQDYMVDNIRDFGRTKSYNHNLNVNYTVPLKSVPILDFTSLKAQYNAEFYWEAASLNVDTLGNLIQNSQNRQLNLTMDFAKLYNKWGYLKKIDGGSNASSRGRQTGPRSRTSQNDRRGNSNRSGDDDDKKKKEREVSAAEKILIRPLLLLRDVKVTYKEDLMTSVPGFMPQSNILGMNPDFTSPGWDFVAGIQPNIDPANQSNWLYQGANQGWFSTSRFLNTQLNQSQQQNFEARIELEPFKDFEIDVEFRKRYMNNHLEEFKNLGTASNQDYQQIALNDIGSFELTYFTLNTFFVNDLSGLFIQFQDSRRTISERLAVRASRDGAPNPLDPHPDDEDYYYGYGRQSDAVLVPAFLATYTGIDPNQADLDIVKTISAWNYIPAPNWTLNYNGLSKMDGLKDIFSSFTIKHGYKSVMRVNNFNTDPVYNQLITQTDPTAIYNRVEEQSLNYFSRLEIPQLTISESFSPLIGVDIKTKTDMNLNFEYRKNRELGMNFNGKELVEQNGEEFVFGFGYTFENVDIPFLTGSKKNNKRSRDNEDNPLLKLGGNSGKVTNNTVGNLLVNVDFSYRDDIVLNYSIDGGSINGDLPGIQSTRGSESIRFSPSVEYDVSQNLGLRLFFEYSRTVPVVTTSFPLTNARGGLTLRFKLN